MFLCISVVSVVTFSFLFLFLFELSLFLSESSEDLSFFKIFSRRHLLVSLIFSIFSLYFLYFCSNFCHLCFFSNGILFILFLVSQSIKWGYLFETFLVLGRHLLLKISLLKLLLLLPINFGMLHLHFPVSQF